MLGIKVKRTNYRMRLSTSDKLQRHTNVFLMDARNHFIIQDILDLNGLGGMDEYFEELHMRITGFSKIARKYGLHATRVNAMWRSAIWIERRRYIAYESPRMIFMNTEVYTKLKEV